MVMQMYLELLSSQTLLRQIYQFYMHSGDLKPFSDLLQILSIRF